MSHWATRHELQERSRCNSRGLGHLQRPGKVMDYHPSASRMFEPDSSACRREFRKMPKMIIRYFSPRREAAPGLWLLLVTKEDGWFLAFQEQEIWHFSAMKYENIKTFYD
jgi:hypothetical protein